MNVMAQAHKMVKTLIAKLSSGSRYKGQYATMLKLALKEAHKEFKAMQTQKTIKLAVVGITLAVELDATWFSLEGTATDSEGNKITISEGGSNARTVQHGADWYFNHNNGFTNIDLNACRWDYKNDKESFKIIR